MSPTRQAPRDQDTLDRELSELSNEIRVVLPAVTVLFAFLLTVPFSARFNTADDVSRAAYFLAFLSSAASVVMLVGESAYHRLAGQPYDQARLMRTASRQAVAGIGLLAVALAAVVFLVTDVLFPSAVAVGVTAGTVLLAAATWLAPPLSRRQSTTRRDPPGVRR